MKNYWYLIATLILGFILGMLVTRQSAPEIKTETVTKWLPGEKVEVPVEVEKLVPYEVVREIPVPEYITVPADTSAIVADYLSRRKYDFDFSTDTTGLFQTHIEVQANQVVSATATIRPLTRVTETTRTIEAARKTQGYAQIGSSLDLNTLKVSGGVDIRNRWMVGASGMKIGDEWGYTLDFGIKF